MTFRASNFRLAILVAALSGATVLAAASTGIQAQLPQTNQALVNVANSHPVNPLPPMPTGNMSAASSIPVIQLPLIPTGSVTRSA